MNINFMKALTIILFIFLTFSCVETGNEQFSKPAKEVENQLINACDFYGINYYDFTYQLEFFLIKKKFLKGTSVENYKRLFASCSNYFYLNRITEKIQKEDFYKPYNISNFISIIPFPKHIDTINNKIDPNFIEMFEIIYSAQNNNPELISSGLRDFYNDFNNDQNFYKRLSLFLLFSYADYSQNHQQYFSDGTYSFLYPKNITDTISIEVLKKDEKVYVQEKFFSQYYTEDEIQYVYGYVDQNPLFYGVEDENKNQKEIDRYVKKEISKISPLLNFHGTVVMSYQVDTNGKTQNFKVLREDHEIFTNYAEKILRDMPKWKPGMQNGEVVSVTCTQAFSF